MNLIAGFECGHLGWCDHDLLVGTQHLPAERLDYHYGIARALGMTQARDGLLWRHDALPRLEIAAATDLDVIWDLVHFDQPPDPEVHAKNIALALPKHGRISICAVNEPSIMPVLSGISIDTAVDWALSMTRVLFDTIGRDRVTTYSVDPINGAGQFQYDATDALMGQCMVDVVGINYYPHDAEAPLHQVLIATWRRYGKPIIVSETSWHDGHPEQQRRFPQIKSKGDWLRYVEQEVYVAQMLGAVVEGLCWYPFVDTPPWGEPKGERWSHGLIRADGTLDPSLVSTILDRKVAA